MKNVKFGNFHVWVSFPYLSTADYDFYP